jgi:hypothetical protein
MSVFEHMEELILMKLLCIIVVLMIYFCCTLFSHLRFSWNIGRD